MLLVQPLAILAALNSTNHDTRFVEKDYCARSIVFAARGLIVHSGKNNGVVCAHVIGHCARWIIEILLYDFMKLYEKSYNKRNLRLL